MSPMEILSAILENPKDIDHVRSLVAPNVTYVSLNYNNPDLKKIMPWCGTSKGPESIVRTFVDVARYWQVQSFQPETVFGSDRSAAMFGRFTYQSTVMKKTVTSPFAVFAKVEDGRCTYLQFMEDTLATSASFRSSGNVDLSQQPQRRGGRVLNGKRDAP